MFYKARLKLTGWYLLIIMVVSLAFSGVIYRSSTLELQRFAQAQRVRYERRMSPLPLLDDELLTETKQHILFSLVILNAGILSLAGILGYYLSGKTLSPIRAMIDEQYRFISDASHELKTPITAITTTLEVALRDEKLSMSEARSTLSISLEEANRLQKLAEALLELTPTNISKSFIPMDLSAAISQAQKTIQPLARKKQIVIKAKLTPIIILGEMDCLSRALVALLDNAIKYSPAKSSITIKMQVATKQLKLAIIDHGQGIEEDHLPFIYDRFYRADPARVRSHTSGYGLGLALAKQIIEEHQGKLLIQSKLGKGTMVTITLPYSAKLQESAIN